MSSGAAAGFEKLQRLSGACILVIVVALYAQALSGGFWPPGHPWSGLALSLLAVQNLLAGKSKPLPAVIVSVGAIVSAVLWGFSVRSTSAARSQAAAVSRLSAVEQAAEETPVSAMGEAAATALGEAAQLAASCRAQGGPLGSGKVRVIYAPDGSAQSVEVLTERFRDTLTGACVRMVFRRSRIPPFNGPSPTFIKAFVIPEQ